MEVEGIGLLLVMILSFGIEIACVITTFMAMIVFMIDVGERRDIDRDSKVLWALMMWFLNILIFPSYWRRYIDKNETYK